MKQFNFALLVLVLFTGCSSTIFGPSTKQIKNDDAKYFKNTKNVPIQKLSKTILTKYSKKINIFETNKDIYLVDYHRGKFKTVEVIPFSTGLEKEYFLGKKYVSDRKYKELSLNAKKLKLSRVDESSFVAYSQKHQVVLYINTDAPIDKLNYNKKHGFDVRYRYLGIAYEFQIEFIDYKKTIYKIKDAIKKKNYEVLYNIKDKYIKKFIKPYLISSLLKIDNDVDLERFSLLFSNFDIIQAESLILVQKENIDIINAFNDIKIKTDKKNFLKIQNKIFEVIDKKLSIRDEPNYKTSEILGHYEQGDIVLAEEVTKNWILTEQGWINKSYLKPKNKILKSYKKKAKQLKL